MERFVKGEKCLKLFKEKGNLLDIDRVRKKRFVQSGCVNRFSVVDGDDIGDLSSDSFLKIGRTCYTRPDKNYLERVLATGYNKDPFTGNVLLPEHIKTLETLPLPARLGQTVKTSKTKLSALREFTSTVGVGLPLLSESFATKKEGVRYLYLKTFSLLFALEREGLLWVPRIHTWSEHGKYFGRYVEVKRDSFCYPKELVLEMKKVRTLPSKTRHVVVPIIVGGGEHANTMVIDRKTKKISFFEPHGVVSSKKYIKSQEGFVKKFAETFGLIGYAFAKTEENCPWFGPQSVESRASKVPGLITGYCETWANLFVYCKIKFPELSDAEIHYGLTHGVSPERLRDLAERFAAFAQSEGKKVVKGCPTYKDSPCKAFLYSGNPLTKDKALCQKF
ncbi:hypothetical protein A9K97_gp211 [Tokyovirus A1]|uniref:hypothetical protein n=1 Tax=Tokyovirus A1 TaxID=1826170 RepID=UPI0007A97BF8|nr:hypothetical protein A9K97_gp211 [Tokyovirus A1]BAU80140.1 hypothetical protein [Tokyovirus A1]